MIYKNDYALFLFMRLSYNIIKNLLGGKHYVRSTLVYRSKKELRIEKVK